MAHNKSALKRIKQDAKKRLRNRARKSAAITVEKTFLAFVEAGKIEDAKKSLVDCFSAYDRAAKKGVLKKATVNRKKSRLALRLNKAQA
jgi:small subunit ribosomal protein S20